MNSTCPARWPRYDFLSKDEKPATQNFTAEARTTRSLHTVRTDYDEEVNCLNCAFIAQIDRVVGVVPISHL